MVQGQKGSKNEHVSGTNKVHQQRRQAKRTKKGTRFIAPKRNKAIQHMKTQKMLEVSIRQSLEKELASRCEEGFRLLKFDQGEALPTGKLLKQKVKQLSSAAGPRPSGKSVDKEVLKAKEEAEAEQVDDDDDDVVGSDDDDVDDDGAESSEEQGDGDSPPKKAKKSKRKGTL